MHIISFLPYYISWHYADGLKGFFYIWRNFFLFFSNLFSIPTLLRTLFSGWHRIKEKYPKSFDIEAFFSALAINIIMIIFGFVVKIFFIILGIFSLVLVGVVGLILLVKWLALPFIVIALLLLGVVKLF
jgi:hypothetical protein